MERITIFTIGFAGKRAETFFTLLRDNSIQRLIDVRLNNASQLAGFTKKDDLRYFLGQLTQISYSHILDLAPTRPLLDSYRRARDWESYRSEFLQLMRERAIENILDPAQMHASCLLCSELQPHHCHRLLVAEYLQSRWGGISIRHLV